MTWLTLLLLSCGAETEEPQDSDPVTTDTRTEPAGCELVEVGFDGPDPPVVGDSWTVWPLCDGDPVFGATVIRVDPATSASLEENVLTWLEPGACTVMAQTGSQRGYLDVEVSANP